MTQVSKTSTDGMPTTSVAFWSATRPSRTRKQSLE